MSTGVAVALIAVLVVLVAVGVYAAYARKGGRGLERRFGPEYERTVARHDGDRKAAERELQGRVKRHGSLSPRPLSAEAYEGYHARWSALQEQFVDAPHQAVAEAEQLLARLAAERGYPAAEDHEQQVEALSVHHAAHVEGYRRLHAAARPDAGTEEMREALLRARGLFEALAEGRHAPQHSAQHERTRVGGVRAPWAHGRRHARGGA